MRGELDELYAKMSDIRRDMRNLRAMIHPEILELHERLDDTVSSIQALVDVCSAHARTTEGIIMSRPPERRLRSRSRSLNRQRLHTDP